MKYLVVLFMLVYIFFGVFPKNGLPSEVNSITIEKFVAGDQDPVGSVKLGYGEAYLLSEEIGYLWCNLFMLNSWEETPHYWLTIDYDGEKQEKVFVSQSEFSTGCRSSEKIISSLEKRLF